MHANAEGRHTGLNQSEHDDRYTSAMRTQPLKQAFAEGGFDVIFGGARRDEEASRAKERVFSVRNAQQVWDPSQQRPELWSLYNLRLSRGDSVRVFPLSNWTELDVLLYVFAHRIELAPSQHIAVPTQHAKQGVIAPVSMGLCSLRVLQSLVEAFPSTGSRSSRMSG